MFQSSKVGEELNKIQPGSYSVFLLEIWRASVPFIKMFQWSGGDGFRCGVGTQEHPTAVYRVQGSVKLSVHQGNQNPQCITGGGRMEPIK